MIDTSPPGSWADAIAHSPCLVVRNEVLFNGDTLDNRLALRKQHRALERKIHGRG